MAMMEPAPLDIISVEFGDRGVTINYYDPALESKVGVRLPSIVLRPEFFEEEIAELREDAFQLILRFNELAAEIPATRPGRVL